MSAARPHWWSKPTGNPDAWSWVDWMWHDHTWMMRRAKIRYEASVLYWRIFHPVETYRRRRETE